jgi:hypothetical protein
VGSGGDVVYCTDDPSHRLEGFYILDYMLSPDIFKYSTGGWKEVMSQVDRLFYYWAPHIHDAYKPFYDDFLKDQTGAPYRWNPKHPLPQIHDESLDGIEEDRLRYCRKASGDVNEFQVVIRHATQQGAQFDYDPDLVELIQNQRDNSQLAFLALHEFFWRYAKDAHSIRQAIRWLFASYDPSSLQDGLIAKAWLDFDPGFHGDTRSLRLYLLHGAFPRYSLVFNADTPGNLYRLIAYNDLPVKMLLYDERNRHVASLSPGERISALVSGPIPLKGVDWVAKSEDGSIRTTIHLKDGHFGRPDIH